MGKLTNQDIIKQKTVLILTSFKQKVQSLRFVDIVPYNYCQCLLYKNP